jgi:hypothetical protein
LDVKFVVNIVVVGDVRWDDAELAVAGVGRLDDSLLRSELVVASHV